MNSIESFNSFSNAQAEPHKCAICLDEIGALHLAHITECNHKFHQRCIQEVGFRQPHTGGSFSCPLCRSKVKSVRIDSVNKALISLSASIILKCVLSHIEKSAPTSDMQSLVSISKAVLIAMMLYGSSKLFLYNYGMINSMRTQSR